MVDVYSSKKISIARLWTQNGGGVGVCPGVGLYPELYSILHLVCWVITSLSSLLQPKTYPCVVNNKIFNRGDKQTDEE